MKIFIYINKKKLPDFFIDAVKEYEKRIGVYCKVRLVSYSSEDDIKRALPCAYTIKVEAGCDSMSSEIFAAEINRFAVSGISSLAFIIGGYTDQDKSISFASVKTEPGLLTVIVYEQLYRAFCIINNKPYHK